jgi:hypothetical protein
MLPLDHYVEAQTKYKAGQKDAALNELARAIGIENPTPVMLNNIEKVFERDCELHNGVVRLVIENSK